MTTGSTTFTETTRSRSAGNGHDPNPQKPHGKPVAGKDRPANGSRRSYPVKQWLNRTDVPPAEHLLGHLLSTTDRVFLIGPTGLGKTMFALALAFRIARGKSFLHWKADGAKNSS